MPQEQSEGEARESHEQEDEQAALESNIELGEEEENIEKESLEHYRLAGMKPLKTLIYLSIGPVIAQVAGALKGIVSTVWISLTLGEIALAAISLIGTLDSISRSFGFFLGSAGAAKISQLYGQKQENEASQVVVDMIRVSIVMGIIVPAILSPITKPIALWLGANDEIAELGYVYMLPINILTFSTILFIALGGCLQGEGRSMFFSILNMFALVVNVIVFDPLFLLGFNTGIWGASFGQALAEFIPFFIIFVMYFMGKFAVKPKFNQFLKPFSPHTLPSLSVGLSQLLVNLSTLIPAFLVRKFMGLAYPADRFQDAMAGYNSTLRYVTLAGSVLIAMNMGYLPAASYAFASKDLRRWLWLTFHCNWISFAWSAITSIITSVFPRQLSGLFGHSPGYLKEATGILYIGNVLGSISFARYCGVAILQSLQMGKVASILSFFSLFVSLVAFACILYYTDKHNGVRLLWSYGLSYSFGFVSSIFVLIHPFYKIFKAIKNENDIDNDIENENEEEDALDDERRLDQRVGQEDKDDDKEASDGEIALPNEA